MTISTHSEPTYVFRLTSALVLRWTSLSIILFLVSLVGVSWFYQTIHGQAWTVSWQVGANQWSGLLAFLAFIAVLIGTLVIHELIHGLAFRVFGGSPRYGIGTKLFLPYAYATSIGDRFDRNPFIVIGLAPLIVLDLLSLLLLAIFPQATWLGWVFIINTSGASGDIWMATLLLRCPKSIQLEDRRTGMAIYTPSNVDPRSLPFYKHPTRTRSILWVWANTTLITLMVFLFALVLLPPIFGLLQVPSFVLGGDSFWLMRWQNDEQGSSIGFNLISLLVIAVAIGLLGVIVQAFSSRYSNNSHRNE